MVSFLGFCRRYRSKPIFRDRRAVTAVEAALVLPVFLLFLFTLFEVAYDQFIQGVLESTVQYTSYQVQVGNSINTTSGKAFVDNELCPNVIAHVLRCGSIFVRIQKFNPAYATCPDLYAATWGSVPVVNRQLQLGDYVGETTPGGSQVGNTTCDISSTGGVGFCNAGPNQFIIMSVIYIAPSFLYALIPGKSYTYNGTYVHAAYATSAFYTEGFTAGTAGTQC